jgi:O-antigen ligase
MWLFIHRPFEIWPSWEGLHVERVWMIVALVAWPISGRIRWTPNPLHLAYAAFALTVLFCWFASPWMSYLRAGLAVENYFKLLVFYVILVTTIRTEADLRKLVLALVAIMALYQLHSAREFFAGRHVYRMGIARMVGVDKSLGDPNSFSASILYIFPFVVPCWVIVTEERPRWRKLLIGYVVLSLFCILMTGSRGALLSLILYTSIPAMRSRHRWKFLSAALLLAPLAWFVLPEHLQDRFHTIIDPSYGPEEAKMSAEGRLEGLWIGVRLWQAYPLTGCGPGAWMPATNTLLESHNLYGQVMGELGTPGVVTFAAIVALLWLNARSIKRDYRRRGWEKDFLYHLADATGIAIIILLFLGNAAHTLYRFNWLWYGAFIIIARHLVDERLRMGSADLPGPQPAA